MIDNGLVAANTRFAFKLFAALARRDRDKNVFVSPAGVALALAMTYTGARGETAQGMARALELGSMPPQALNHACAALLRALTDLGPQLKLAIASSLWARQDLAIGADFERSVREYYQAELVRLDFAQASAAAAINEWVQRHTGGKIKQMVNRIDPAAALYLINAIYFKGRWTRPFNQRLTRDAPFTLLDGRRKQQAMMAQSGKYRYCEGQEFQAVSLPYGGERLSMYVLLPAARSGLDALFSQLDGENWDDWMQRFRPTDGQIALPRFRLEYQVTLNDALNELGMAVALGPRADFSGMLAGSSVPMRIDEVKHKTFIEVNEEGTEAAAATSVGVVLTSFSPRRRFTMIVDRPFFCAIRDNQTGAILFMGSIVDPE